RNRLEHRLDDVVRVRRAQRLGQDVLDPGEFEHGAHAAAGDDTGTGAGRTKQHAGSAEFTDDLVGNRRPDPRHGDHAGLGAIDRLADRVGDFRSLAERVTDVTVVVTDDDDRVEAEAPAAGDDLGDASDVNDLLGQLVGVVDANEVLN